MGENLSNLVKQLNSYRTNAVMLEEQRRDLVKNLSQIVAAEIIPRVQEQLPPGFGINTEESSIINARPQIDEYHRPDSDSIPNGFGLHIRLLYGGQRISSCCNVPKGAQESVGDIQRLLEPELKKISKEYGLSEVQVFGEPVQMV